MRTITRTQIHSQGTSSGWPGRHEIDVNCFSEMGIIDGADHTEWSKCEAGEIIDLKRGVIAVESGQGRV